MNIRLAIHNRTGSFSDRWIQYCNENGINYKAVCCYDSDILEQIKGVDGFLWHWKHNNPTDVLVARQIIAAIEKMGIKVFPNIATCWHFDDKIAQKYMLEAIGAPFVQSYVFYDKKKAMQWIDKAEFPNVFKLRCGAGSQNVKLLNTRKEARKLCEKAFGEGFTAISGYLGDTTTKIANVKSIEQFMEKLRRMPKEIYDISKKKHFFSRERGYIYFQDFLPDNKFDIRITVIGDRAFGFIRHNRPNDFRASGSGNFDVNQENIPLEAVSLAHQISKTNNFQSMSYDFLSDSHGNLMISEISYCYASWVVHECPGYWERDLNWHDGHMWPGDAIIIDLISEIS